MTFKPMIPNIPNIPTGRSGKSTPQEPGAMSVSVSPALTTAAIVLVCLALGVPPGTLLLSATLGAVTGWLHRFVKIRNPRLDAFVSALFGTNWHRDDRVLIAIDILSRALVGVAVGLVFAELGGALLGAGNGPPPDLFDLAALFVLLLRLVVFVLCVAFVGAGVAMLAEGVPLHLLANSAAAIAAGAGKAIIKAAAAAAAEEQQAGMSYGRIAQKGAVTAVLVAVAGVILGL
jgi:hypothetical protein